MAKNCAFVFIKPHAVTEQTKALVKEDLTKAGLTITGEGSLASEVIDKQKLVDQHYYAIASKATIMKPKELNVNSKLFQDHFGLSWTDALAAGNVYNALDACEAWGISAMELDQAWQEAKKGKKLVKLGGGFYCGLLEKSGKKPIYVMNGFFMEMRVKFTAPGLSIYWYTVEWDAAKLSWADFRGKLLGPTDPADAPVTSLRGKILAQWQSLGLKASPNVGDNGVHASASPFEGLAERLNWVGATLASDPFGQALQKAGVPEATIRAWTVDPQVTQADGKSKSLFDSLEDKDVTACLAECVALAKLNPPPAPSAPSSSSKSWLWGAVVAAAAMVAIKLFQKK